MQKSRRSKCRLHAVSRATSPSSASAVRWVGDRRCLSKSGQKGIEWPLIFRVARLHLRSSLPLRRWRWSAATPKSRFMPIRPAPANPAPNRRAAALRLKRPLRLRIPMSIRRHRPGSATRPRARARRRRSHSPKTARGRSVENKTESVMFKKTSPAGGVKRAIRRARRPMTARPTCTLFPRTSPLAREAPNAT